MKMMKRVFGTLLVLIFTSSLRANEAALAVVVRATAVRPGTVVNVYLVGVNPSVGQIVRFQTQRAIAATIRTGGRSIPVQLEAINDAPRVIAPQAFAFRVYSLAVPEGLSGETNLIVPVGKRELIAGLFISADAPLEADAAIPSVTPALDRFPRILPGRMSIYHPIYFVFGADSPNSKFQLSLKYRIANLGPARAEGLRPTLQVAYTQRSLWDTSADSSPFYDTTYSPEVFIEWLTRYRPTGAPFQGLAAGIRHASNGKAGADSRSYNIGYVRAHMAVGSPEGWYVSFAPEIWADVTSHERMPDLEKYRGSGILHVVLGKGAGEAMHYSVAADRRFDRLTHELNLTVPIRMRVFDFATYVVVQYFNGYGEGLLDYTMKSEHVRAGLSLIR